MKADKLEKKRDPLKGSVIIEEKQPVGPGTYAIWALLVVIALLIVPKPYHASKEEVIQPRTLEGKMLVKAPKCFGIPLEFGGNPYDISSETDSRFFTHVCFGVPLKVKETRNLTGF
jgi:hypothetical protein